MKRAAFHIRKTNNHTEYQSQIQGMIFFIEKQKNDKSRLSSMIFQSCQTRIIISYSVKINICRCYMSTFDFLNYVLISSMSFEQIQCYQQNIVYKSAIDAITSYQFLNFLDSGKMHQTIVHSTLCNQSVQDDGSKKTLLRLADQEAPSSIGFLMIDDQNKQDSYSQQQLDKQENDFQQQSNNKKKERKKHHSLKYLSWQVHKLVGSQRETTYKQMADQLASEISKSSLSSDSKNLKRRVYDSINVMVALGVLEKQKKIIIKGQMFQQNHMTSKYVRDTRDRYEILRQQQYEELKRKKILFQKLTDQARRINALIDQNKYHNTAISIIRPLQKDESDFLQGQQPKIYQFPIMIFKLPQNAKLNIITIEGKTIVQILSDHEIKIVGDYDILPLIKRVEEAKDKNLPGPMLNL
ncbi:unnamed protein product (macronuclear) [Paramecium tetraurelia]|uniref:E2F/DP family winged-helix DNA-binding domain-containing protein n=1 Tax=Paramecium tetraurelia TaxID=5888 RepID=A0D614_PARTE|nr:uncharacterized protein GSPATT00013911001 [Paramecium tetraurelia]CAK78481.1 unnamed protein product [Paramecium tetraurelia]|eukprot:XP_001445878.1 hypothetical protein (macronuclear) [Paramecium tetraurelia strain d4-2]